MTGATYTASWYLYEPGDDSVAKGRRASFEQVMRREQTRLASEGWEIEFAYQEAFDSEIGEFFLVLIWAISMTSCFVYRTATTRCSRRWNDAANRSRRYAQTDKRESPDYL